MPVPYRDLSFDKLMHNRGAYDLIAKEGRRITPGWNIVRFEKFVLRSVNQDGVCMACSPDHFAEFKEYVLGSKNSAAFGSPDDINLLKNGLSVLDEKMPYLLPDEEGQHYAYELFLSPPSAWGYRGEPMFWAYTARKFTQDKLPMDIRRLSSKYMETVNEFRIPFGKDERAYVHRFDTNGMSGGIVDGIFVMMGLYTLLDRMKMYN